MNVSWPAPSRLNGPPPLYTVGRLTPAFNYPPSPVESGTRFTGAGYYLFPPHTIPQGVTFTGAPAAFSRDCAAYMYMGGSVAEWLACWTQAQKARVQIAAATLSGNSLGQTVHTHRASVH